MHDMIRISFRQATVTQLERHLRRAIQVGDARRIKHISALLSLADGLTVSTIAERLGVARTTVYTWLHAFLVDGWDSLTYRKPPGRPARLTKTQKQRLCDLVSAGPEAAGYATGCWNAALIQALIQREFGVCYHVHYVSQLLRNLGFSYQKARFVAAKRDDDARAQWRTQTWPRIVREARRQGALLLFGDEASFAQWGSLGYTWAPRGKQPEVKTSGTRKGYKVFGLTDHFSGRLFFQGSTERFTATRYEAFLRQVLRETSQPIVLIQDGARYHTAKTMQTFFAQHADRLTVYQLPAYSPDDHPIEHLWRNVKRDKTHNTYFPTFESLVAAVDTALSTLQQQPHRVKQLMGTCLDKLVPTEFASAA
jgi:transposase